MTDKPVLIIELGIIALSALICTLLLTNLHIKTFETPPSWPSLAAKLSNIQKLCRNASAIRKTAHGIELIDAEGLLVTIGVKKYRGRKILEIQRRSNIKVERTIRIHELEQIELNLKQPNQGLQASDFSIKGLFSDDSLPIPLAVMLDLSLSNPKFFKEIDL